MPFHHPASLSRAETIARLNDRARFGFDRTSKTIFSRACLATFCNGDTRCALVAQSELVDAMRQHLFTDDAHRERDFGEMVFRDHRVWFKIDYYSPGLDYGSADPADAIQTVRVITIMLPEDY
jgi:hypothetical protein